MTPRSIQARLTGMPELKKALEALALEHPQAAARALYQMGMQVGAQAVRTAPVLYGVLRSSGYVAPPAHRGLSDVVEIGFGTVYAAYQHEGHFRHPRGGEVHYLEKAVRDLATLDKVAAFARANVASGKGAQATSGGRALPAAPNPNHALRSKAEARRAARATRRAAVITDRAKALSRKTGKPVIIKTSKFTPVYPPTKHHRRRSPNTRRR